MKIETGHGHCKHLYILSCTVDREIHTPQIFMTLYEAQNQMKDEFIEVTGTPDSEIGNIDDEPFDNGEARIESLQAYCTNKNHANVDWHIHRLSANLRMSLEFKG